MKDVLIQRQKGWIKARLEGSFPGEFCYFRGLNGVPEQTEEGQRILVADEESGRVLGESVLADVSEGELRFFPLTPVRKPAPEDPPSKGFKYVDADSCGKYSIEFMGVEHVYKNLDKLLRGILEKRPETRDDLDLLYHIIWTEVQNLNLNEYCEYQERLVTGKLKTLVDQIQVQESRFPPRTPEKVEERWKNTSKGLRKFEDLERYLQSVKGFYRENGQSGVVDELDNYFDFRSKSEKSQSSKERVLEAVNG